MGTFYATEAPLTSFLSTVRGVFADSGGIIALGPITQPSKQLIFDIFANVRLWGSFLDLY